VFELRKRIKEYLKRMDKLLEERPDYIDWEKVLSEHLQQLSFFMHERLIHLLVTLAFGLSSIGVGLAAYFSGDVLLGILLLGLLVLLIPYIFHYYVLENGVQKMYRQYDEILGLLNR
jgi:lipopolysaccharide export LptBFGC system permease protein LptF